MFDDYQTLVLQHYEKKRDEGDLPTRLVVPTLAQIRDQCLIEFNKGVSRKDRKILVDFFKESGDDDAIRETIRNFKPDDFKALWKYLKGQSTSTSLKNIELLAWLIDFESRPFELGKSYNLTDLQSVVTTPEAVQDNAENKEEKEEQAKQVEENKIPKIEVADETPQVSATIVTDKSTTQVDDNKEKPPLVVSPLMGVKQRVNWKIIMGTLAVVILAAAAIFKYSGNEGNRQKNRMGSTLNKENGCMYWAGDHYQQVPCSQKMGDDTLAIALDMEKLNSFKKITRPDTITRNDIGKIWYIKLNNNVEFYTANGNYPLDLKRKLKPITDHIISTYIDSSRQGISY